MLTVRIDDTSPISFFGDYSWSYHRYFYLIILPSVHILLPILHGSELSEMSHQGMQNKDQTREQIEKQDKRNDVELGDDFQIGNTKSQSQKKSGRQANRK